MGASVSCVAGEGNGAPLLYLPGMDGIGYTFSAQADLLATRGYEVWCLKLPASDRRPLDALAEALAPLVARVAERHGTGVTLVAESFGAPTALRLAGSAHTGSAVSRLVLCNPATNLSESNMLVGTASAAGLFQLLPLVPTELISWARGTVWPLMLEEGRVDPKVVSGGADVVPADTVTFRLSQLAADSGRLSDSTLRRVHQKVLVISSAKDRVLDSVAEGRRLQALLRDATTVVLPDSGHVALLERGIDLPALMADNGVDVPAAPVHARRGTEDGNARAKGGDGAGRSSAVAAFDDAGRERGGSTRARRGNRPSSRIPPAPTDDDYKMLATLMTPWKAATAPLVLGAENLPSPGQRDGRAVLFVGNHGRMGLYDLPLLLLELHELGFSARGLAHRSHYASGNPMGPIFERFGAVQVTPMSVFELLTRGENVLLFPGGAQEVLKRDGQQNKVIWKSEVDFVRLAAKTDALIVPFASVGADDAFKWHTDTDELLALPVVGDAIRESVKMVDSSLQVRATRHQGRLRALLAHARRADPILSHK